MSKVYIPQVPSRFDAGTRLWIPTMNLDPAQKFGELFVMLPPEANRLHTAPLVAALRERMIDFKSDDYLVAVGDPTILSAAACIAVKKTGGKLRMLKWDRMSRDYFVAEFDL